MPDAVSSGIHEDGFWALPDDMLSMVHQGEMIVPAAATPWAQSLMANAASGGGGGGRSGGGSGVTINVNTLDAGTTASWLKGGGARLIAHHIEQQAKYKPRIGY